jgi:hypothetical protein
MQPTFRSSLLCSLLVTLLLPVTASAGTENTRRKSGRATLPATENPAARAGYPRRVAPWATTWPGSRTRGHYVGGGAPLFGFPATTFRGEGRHSSEGTFGVDYMPWYSHYNLHWYHGNNQQGGEGQYEADHRVNPLDDFLGFGPRRRAFPRGH